MKGKIVNFRRSLKRTYSNHMILIFPHTIHTREKAQAIVGKEVVYHTPTKDIKGKISSAHGSKGAVRAIFETGMPGQSIGKDVDLK